MVDKNQELNPVAKTGKPSRSGLWFGLLNLLIAIGLAVAGFFLYLQYSQLQKEQTTLTAALEKQANALTGDLSNLKSLLATQAKTIENLNTELSTQDSQFERGISNQASQTEERLKQLNTTLERTKTQLAQSIQRVDRRLGQTRSDWLIADAEYLLTIANQRIQFVGDVKTSIEALEGADQRLRESGDSGVFKVREAIAREVNQLKAVPTSNTTDLFLRLKPLINQIDDLPLLLPSQANLDAPPRSSDTGPDTAQAEQQDSNDYLGSAVEEVKSWVTVRRRNRPMDAVLTPKEATLIHHILRLHLETARLALVNRNETIYTDSLESAARYLNEHFDESIQTTQAFVKELQTLRERPFNVKFPDISRSLKLLRDITRLRLESDRADAKPSGSHQP